MILIQLPEPAEHKSPLMMSLHSSPHNPKKSIFSKIILILKRQCREIILILKRQCREIVFFKYYFHQAVLAWPLMPAFC
jgi:hypothetical protein